MKTYLLVYIYLPNDLPPLEGDEEEKSDPEETTAERMKLNPQKRKITGTRLKILSPNKLLNY